MSPIVDDKIKTCESRLNVRVCQIILPMVPAPMAIDELVPIACSIRNIRKAAKLLVQARPMHTSIYIKFVTM